jgi:hypothetical protein
MAAWVPGKRFCPAYGSLTLTTGPGVSMIPYLGFNAWFIIGPGRGFFTNWLWMDVVGNMVFLSGSLFAAKLLKGDEEEHKKAV